MSNYDSILKEKVKYEDPLPLIPQKEKKKFPYLLIDIIAILLVSIPPIISKSLPVYS